MLTRGREPVLPEHEPSLAACGQASCRPHTAAAAGSAGCTGPGTGTASAGHNITQHCSIQATVSAQESLEHLLHEVLYTYNYYGIAQLTCHVPVYRYCKMLWMLASFVFNNNRIYFIILFVTTYFAF